MVIKTTTFESKLDEIAANARIVQNAGPILARHRAAIYDSLGPMGTAGKEEIRQLRSLLELLTSDNASSFQGLLLITSGILESFIFRAVDQFIYEASQSPTYWNAQNRMVMKTRYLGRAGAALNHLPSGTYDGADFDFDRLTRHLALTLADNDELAMAGDVFSVRFGTCSSEKIEKLFEKIKLTGPFDANLGRHGAVLGIAKEKSPTRAANYLKAQVDELASIRNKLAHGLPTKEVTLAVVELYVEVVRVFILGVTERLKVT